MVTQKTCICCHDQMSMKADEQRGSMLAAPTGTLRMMTKISNLIRSLRSTWPYVSSPVFPLNFHFDSSANVHCK